jgi:hypothetical protein
MRKFLLVGLLASLGLRAFPAAELSYEESYVSAFHRWDSTPALLDRPYGYPTRTDFDSDSYTVMPFDPNTQGSFRVYLKGHTLARVGLLSTTIYNLETATVTLIDKEKRTFSTVPFTQMRKQIDKGPGCGSNCTIRVKETGRTARVAGANAEEHEISAFVGKPESPEFIAHASYWTVSSLPEGLQDFIKVCHEKSAPQDWEVCAQTLANGFGPVAAVKGLEGFVVARVIETRSRAAGLGPERSGWQELGKSEPRAPWEVYTGPTAAQIRRTETRISNIVEGQVDESVFLVPAGYRETKRPR